MNEKLSPLEEDAKKPARPEEPPCFMAETITDDGKQTIRLIRRVSHETLWAFLAGAGATLATSVVITFLILAALSLS